MIIAFKTLSIACGLKRKRHCLLELPKIRDSFSDEDVRLDDLNGFNSGAELSFNFTGVDCSCSTVSGQGYGVRPS